MAYSLEQLKSVAKKEAALLLTLLFAGLFLLPLSIYLVGQLVFGEYSGAGFAGFYGRMHHEIRDGQPVVWFLVLSPYIIWQLLRLTIWGYRHAARHGEPDARG